MREVTRTFLKLVIGFLGVLVLSALLAPGLAAFLPFKFDRILRRLIMVGTLLLVAWLLRRRRESVSRMGLGWNQGSLRLLGGGLLVGIAMVAGIDLIQWGIGARLWRLHETDGWHWIGLFFKGLSGGILIGVIEEFFFRGFLFLMLKDLWNTKASLGVTNAIYALVHFFPRHVPTGGGAPTVGDSFQILLALLPSFWNRPEILLATTGLFLFGLILSLAFLRSGSLYLPIGIHAGCVFSLKMSRRFLPEIAPKMNLWSGSKNLYDGVAGLLFLTLTLALVAWSLRSQNKTKGEAPCIN